MSEALTWRVLPFDAMAPATLYGLLQLRSQVFVVEQACVFQDLDGHDSVALHVLGTRRAPPGASELVACARLLPAHTAFSEASIGRVATRASERGTGLGHRLMEQSIAVLHGLWGVQPIRLGAQVHLQAFYTRHGFAPLGPVYTEDGIPHIEMLRL